MNLKEENERLVKENANIVEAINLSKLALEEAQKQELAGKSILSNLEGEIKKTQNSLESVKEELAGVNTELVHILKVKAETEAAISETKKEAQEDHQVAKAECEAELAKLHEDIKVKRHELTELLSKIKTESFNLTTIQGQISSLDVELSKAQSIYDDVVTKCKVKNEDLDALNNDYANTTSALVKAKQVLKDTEISTEAYDDRKAVLITELAELEEAITANKVEIAKLKTEITDLAAKKEVKEAEYNASVSKIFDLLRREEAVAEREEYARGRFKDAGLEY